MTPPNEYEKCRHGWKGTVPDGGLFIADRCPACENKSLFIGSGGWITCGNLKCRRLTLPDWLEDAANLRPAQVEAVGELVAAAQGAVSDSHRWLATDEKTVSIPLERFIRLANAVRALPQKGKS